MKVNASNGKLIDALQDGNINVNTTELLRELSGGDQSVRGIWSDDNLSDETLLTKEELSLYNSLQKFGQVDAFLEQEGEDHVRALTNHEIQEAINQLRSSTVAIEKQSEILRVQQDAFVSLAAFNGLQAQRRSAANGLQQRTWLAEKDQVNNALEELTTGLSDYVTEIESQIDTSDYTLEQHASEILHSDDKILVSLGKLSGALRQDSSGADDCSERIKKLCARLIKFTVEGVRVKLDRLYLEALEGHPGSLDDEADVQSEEMAGLKAELESLYSEIVPVAQMSAEQRYLQLAFKKIAAQGGQGAQRSKKITKYISGCINFLVHRLESFSNQVEDYQEHIATLRSVTQLLRADITTLTSALAKQPQQQPSPKSRRKSRVVSSGRSFAGRPRMPRRTSCSLSLDESSPPEHQILQILGLPAEDISTEAFITNTLHASLSDRLQKLGAQEISLQFSTEAAIAEQIHDRFVTLQLLRDNLLGEYRSGKVELVDEDVQAAISGLELELADLRADLQNVDLEKLRERDVNREAFIERWTH